MKILVHAVNFNPRVYVNYLAVIYIRNDYNCNQELIRFFIKGQNQIYSCSSEKKTQHILNMLACRNQILFCKHQNTENMVIYLTASIKIE